MVRTANALARRPGSKLCEEIIHLLLDKGNRLPNKRYLILGLDFFTYWIRDVFWLIGHLFWVYV